jgi:creatinine amidohydrolase
MTAAPAGAPELEVVKLPEARTTGAGSMSTFSVQMRRAIFLATILAGALAGRAMAQAPDASCALPSARGCAAPCAKTDLVEFEKMTWVEVKCAIAAGKTTALIYTGGVEERGPQNANGGHNLIAHATVEAIARKLGNAIFLPVLPYTPNDAEPIPGTIGITNELLAAMLERLTEQAFLNGFHRVILMGDHAGGQPDVYEGVAKKLNARYGALRVFYCDQVYRPANDAFDQYLAQHGYPPGLHGYVFDTSEMMYLDKDNTWVRRDLVSSAVGDPVVDGKVQVGPQSPYNGIQGDARRSTVELGKLAVDMKVDYAVRQIRSLPPTE